ncbi:hypothetical protein D6D01_07960 [Aureobasidium pullulans]|uniref:Uncharacterized protein n=1 Tax=Aureobasidium pullulans TaxID=5580 RepID=A0A4S9KGU4_AURPU|nr:hypothetical protein D6D01_07960 [Aureobasidium pullulans]
MAGNIAQWSAQCDQSLDALAQDERLRMRTLARYFLPAQITADTLRAISGQPVPPTLSQDTHLTALAQLGPLKLQCDRAFISLLSTSTQFIIAEATRSISLRQTNRFRGQQDALFLGVQALHKSYGVCPNTVNIFTDSTGTLASETPDIVANTNRYIIRDFRALDLFKDRPYVVGFPHMRSYAEVPLTSSNGRVIGSYCVVDDALRDDFFDDDTTFVLTEIADSIVNYLDSVNVKHAQARGERLMEGLSMFAEKRFISMAETNLRKERRAWSRSKFNVQAKEDCDQVLPDLWPSSSSSQSTRPISISSTRDSDDNRTDLTTPSENSRSLGDPASSICPTTPLDRPTTLDKEASETSHPSNPRFDIFDRAAAIIRDALDIDGVAFFSASDQAQKRGFGSNCQRLGNSLAPGHFTEDFRELKSSSLEYLCSTFPKGQIFSVDQFGASPFDSDTHHIDDFDERSDRSTFSSFPADLQEGLPTARSLLFLPLRELSTNVFFAGLIGWTADPIQHIGKDDLISLRAFGNAVMTELARSEADYVSRAKSDFISSISHELRSPLHGVLASVELLNDSTIGESDKDIVHMIETCGTTLLDTLNHLLDYSQINRFNGSRSKSEGQSTSENSTTLANVHGQTSVTSLDQLIIDVVESVHLGVQSQRAPKTSLSAPQNGQNNVGIHVNIQHGPDWRMPLHVGAWKRVIMNIFANSMKFTPRGFIEILLSVVKKLDTDGNEREYACLVGNDSGCGMSTQYLEQQLFTPFIQEDSAKPGTGLGMSLVKQIVEDFAGVINVESVQGIGTRTELLVPLSRASKEAKVGRNSLSTISDPVGALKGQTICLVKPSGHDNTKLERGLRGDRAESLTSLLSDITQDWLGMKFSIVESLTEKEADFFVVCDLLQDEFPDQRLDCSLIPTGKRIISIGLNGRGLVQLGDVTTVSYPISPRSLCKALLASLKTSQTHQANGARGRTQTQVPVDSVETPSSAQPTSGVSADHNYGPPCKPSQEHTEQPNKAKSLSSRVRSQTRQPEHALIVDDNAINLKILQSYLKKLGCTVATATNGLEAVEVYKATKTAFDIVFMDISMPIMDGFEASRKIREYETSSSEQVKQPTYIIALTGLGSDSSRQEAAISGIDQFHTKPVKLDHIRTLLSSLSAESHGAEDGKPAPPS